MFKGKLHSDCVTSRDKAPQCYYEVDKALKGKKDAWGHCLPEEKELVPRKNQKVSSTYLENSKCAHNYHHICGMNNMYGGITIHWNNGTIDLGNYAPESKKYNGSGYEEALSTVTIDFIPEWKKQN